MWLELVLASVLGFVIYWFVSRDKEETLPLEDGWWGTGSKPSAKEDESIRPFKVETSDEEIKVRHPFPDRAETKASVLLCFPGTRVVTCLRQRLWKWTILRFPLATLLPEGMCILFPKQMSSLLSPFL